jgi:hypothetical protein
LGKFGGRLMGPAPDLASECRVFPWAKMRASDEESRRCSTNQTLKLFKKFKDLFSGEAKAVGVIQRVVLMTPENIHLNSFMYEPILDMSDEHLKRLYGEVLELK